MQSIPLSELRRTLPRGDGAAPPPPPPWWSPSHPLWALGFRPLYLAAAAWAALAVLAWALAFPLGAQGGWHRPALPGALWHAHEMVFGFSVAVIAGFLFTAGRNWSGQPTPTGRTLQCLVAAWLTARLSVLLPWSGPDVLAALLFPLGAAWGLGRALVAAGNRRNYFFIGLLVMLGLADGAWHLAVLAERPDLAQRGLALGLNLVLVIASVMAGRVVPMFTRNGVPGSLPQRRERLEQAVTLFTLALVAADLAGAEGAWLAVPALAAFATHAARLWGWQPWKVARAPLVAVLHAAMAWVALHLLLRAAAAMGWVNPSLATHALTVGGIGTLTLGMMTRTALGHTGRRLHAGRLEVTAYALVLLAALVRVGVPLVWPGALIGAVQVSGGLWALAFGLYAWGYAPILGRPRADGRPD